jgi:hypothetical protein
LGRAGKQKERRLILRLRLTHPSSGSGRLLLAVLFAAVCTLAVATTAVPGNGRVDLRVYIWGSGTIISKPAGLPCAANPPTSERQEGLRHTASCVDGLAPVGLLLYPKPKPGFRFTHWQLLGTVANPRACSGHVIPCRVSSASAFFVFAFFHRK